MNVLLYMPCHTDFSLALNQVERFKQEFDHLKTDLAFKNFSLEVVLSINSYLPIHK